VHGSDRFVEGTSPVLIRNAKILTGARNGNEVVFGDVLLDKGVILGVGYVPRVLTLRPNLQVIDAEGKWISPGSVDAHSHLGVYSAPSLAGASSAFEFLYYGRGQLISAQAHRTGTPSRRRFYLGYAVLTG
jgi:predicted amidohydrolase